MTEILRYTQDDPERSTSDGAKLNILFKSTPVPPRRWNGLQTINYTQKMLAFLGIRVEKVPTNFAAARSEDTALEECSLETNTTVLTEQGVLVVARGVA